MMVRFPERHTVFGFSLWRAACASLLTIGSVASAAQKSSEPASEKKPQESTDKEPAPVEALPDLDDLLDLPSTRDENKDGRPQLDPDQLELDRALNAQTVSEMFQQAVQQMADAADLLRKAHDTGLATQRVQEEIILKLNKLIEEAERQQSSSSSSSSSQQQQKQKQKSKQPAQPQQAQNQGNQGENKGERTPPAGQQANLKGKIESLGAAWGALPTRLREALLQGAGDTYSSLYESMTEAYYRKLAEQNKDLP
jgi:hypothetical protein